MDCFCWVFFERCCLITNARYKHLYALTVAVMKVYSSIKNNQLLKYTFLLTQQPQSNLISIFQKYQLRHAV